MSQKTKNTLLDFFIMLIISGIIIGGGSFLHALLYHEENYTGIIEIVSEPMPKELSNYLSVGDELFDNVTKRTLGKVITLDILEEKPEYVKLRIQISANRRLRGQALQNKDIFLFVDETNYLIGA